MVRLNGKRQPTKCLANPLWSFHFPIKGGFISSKLRYLLRWQVHCDGIRGQEGNSVRNHLLSGSRRKLLINWAVNCKDDDNIGFSHYNLIREKKSHFPPPVEYECEWVTFHTRSFIKPPFSSHAHSPILLPHLNLLNHSLDFSISMCNNLRCYCNILLQIV